MGDLNNKLCEEFQNDLWLYIDNSLKTTQKQYWDSHLKVCANCTGLLKSHIETTTFYNEISNDDLADTTFKRIIQKATEFENQSAFIPSIQRSRSLSEIFGFYKLAFGGSVLAAALIFIFITFFNNPNLPEIENQISEEILSWDFPSITKKTEDVENQIISLKTDDWNIYVIKKNNKEEWNSALKSIYKQIRKMKKEVSSASM